MTGRTSSPNLSILAVSILALLSSPPSALSGDMPAMAPPPGQGTVGGGAPKDTAPLPDHIGDSSRGGQGKGESVAEPDITGVSPSGCFRAGDSAALKGKNFGQTKGSLGLSLHAPGGKISIRNYGKWSDGEISFDIPPGVPGGGTAPVVLGDGKREYDRVTLSFCAAEGGLGQADLGKSGAVMGAKAQRGDAAALKSRMRPKSAARLLVPGKGEGAAGASAMKKDPVPVLAQKNGSGGKNFGTKAAGLKAPVAGGPNREHPVREDLAARRLSIAALPPPAAKADTAPGKANLVCEVEARNGVHTFNGTFIPVKVTNRGEGPSTGRLDIGIKRHGVISFGGTHWIARRSTGPLDPGESIVVEVPWEEEITDTLYVASADILDSSDEGSAGREGDNDSRPFMVHLFEMVKITMPLTVQQPEGGAYFRGGLLTVVWKTFGLAEGVPLRVGLYQGGAMVRDIALQGAPSRNWTAWKIPKNFSKGTYRVRVQTGDGAYSAESPSFEIADGAIEVLKPGAGSSWFAGNTYDVLWEADVYKWPDHAAQGAAFEESKEATVSLVSAGQALSIITPLGIIADFRKGRFSWPIPAAAAPGSYKISVTSADGLFFGESKTFEIVPPDAPLYEVYSIFEVDTPSDEYGWATGSTHTVLWRIDPLKLQSGKFDFSRAASRVDIDLLDGQGTVAAEIATGMEYRIEGSWKSVGWEVPGDLENGLYRLRVRTTDGVFTGESDRFSIFTAKVFPVAAAGMAKDSGGGASGMETIDPARIAPPDGEALDLKVKIVDILPGREFTLESRYGERGAVGEFDIVVEVEANKPFWFGDLDGPGAGGTAGQWSLAELEVTVGGWTTADHVENEYCMWAESCSYFANDPTGAMGYRKEFKTGSGLEYPGGMMPAGKSTITLTAGGGSDTRILYFYAVNVVGKVAAGGKCLKRFDPEAGAGVKFTTRKVPAPPGAGYASSPYREQTVYSSKIFRNPRTVLKVDTTLFKNALGFTPPWSHPVVFAWDGIYPKCDRPYEGELVGGP